MIFDDGGGLLDRVGIGDIDGQNQSSPPRLFDLAPGLLNAPRLPSLLLGFMGRLSCSLG